jgi:acetyltransferase-like isoleucine patch superfamily enzyme
MLRTVGRRLVLMLNYLLWLIAPSKNTRFICWWLRRWGARIEGMPRYISAKVWIDGTSYPLIELGEECTVSSNVRILTHDWAADTVARGLGIELDGTLGRRKEVRIGNHAFVGTGSILLPGSSVGKCAIVGAGSVVRGEVPDYAILVGSPGRIVGDSRDYVSKLLNLSASEFEGTN